MAKKLVYYGKTAEEVAQMDMETFTKLLRSRQRRSLARGFTDAQKALLAKVRAKNAGTYTKDIKTHCRDMVILPEMLGQTIHVYSGKTFVPVLITLEHLGDYLGMHALTRLRIKHSSPGVGATKSSTGTGGKK